MRGRERRRVYDDDLPKTHDVRYGFLFLVGLVGILVGLYAIGYFAAGNKLPWGTAIGGVDVGGMTPTQARVAVHDGLAPRMEQPLTLVAAGGRYRLEPQQAGLAFDIDASITTALGGESWDPRHMVRVLLGGAEIDPELVIDEAKLDAAVARVAAELKREPRNASVSFATGRPEVVFGRTGQALDVAQSKRRLATAVRVGERHVRLPLNPVEPTITNAEARTFASTVGAAAVRDPVTLRVADTKLILEPRIFAPVLATEVEDSELRLTADASRLYQRSQGVLGSLPHAPVNAKIGFGRSRPVVIPGRTGVSVDARAWATAVLRAVSREGAERKAAVPTEPLDPTFTTKDARELGVRARVSTASTRYPTLTVADLAPAARQLDGALLKPGETLSFLDQVDARADPQAATLVAATTFDAAFKAGLTALERSPTVFYSAQYPLGRDARVRPPNRDLLLRNDSPYGVFFRATVDRLRNGGAIMHVDLWSTPYWQIKVQTSNRHQLDKPRVDELRSPRCRPQPGSPGFEVDVTRIFLRRGERVNSDVTHSEYARQDRVVCR